MPVREWDMGYGGKKTYEPDWVDRFIAKINKTDSCWLWTAAISEVYGKFGIGQKVVLAHRLAYELWVGPIPNGKELHHTCSVRSCVNPSHLLPVTREEHPGSGPDVERSRTHCTKGHPLDGCFTRGSTGRQVRYCKTCNRENQRRINASRR